MARLAPLPWWREEWVLALALVGMVLVAYLPVMRAGFILDDDDYLTNNPSIIGPQGLKEVWTTRAARICPLVITSFWVQHAIWGLEPLPYHLVNVLLHGLCSVLLWRVLLGLGISRLVAWLAAAFWALHPVQVDTVAWISELKNTQSGFFYLLSVLYFVKWRHRENSAALDRSGRGHWNYAISLLCAALALASKSSTVVLPVVLGLCAWWVDGRWQWRLVWRLSPFVFLSGLASAWSVWEQESQGGIGGEWALTGLERIIVPGRAVWFYLGKLLWPLPLTIMYPRWELDTSSMVSYLPTLVAAIIFLLLWRFRDGRLRPVFFALSIFLVALLPALGLVDHFFLRYSFVGDHFQYLACMGPLTLAAAGFVAAGTRFQRRGHSLLPTALVAALLLGLGVVTWRHAGVYENEGKLWTDTAKKNPRSWLAHNNLAAICFERGRMDDSVAHAKQSIELNPNFEASHINLANALTVGGRMEEAIASYERAIAINPDLAKSHYNYGSALIKFGRVEEAINHFRKAVEISPTYFLAHNNLGSALVNTGRPSEAVPHCEKVVELCPDNAQFRTNLGNALVQSGQADRAVFEYRKALEIDPRNEDAQVNLGMAFVVQGRLDDALRAWEGTLKTNPQALLALRSLAWVLATCPADRFRDGLRALELASRADRVCNGKNPLMAGTLAAAYAETGQFAAAQEAAERALALAKAQGNTALAGQLSAQIEVYRAAKPWRDPDLRDAAASAKAP